MDVMCRPPELLAIKEKSACFGTEADQWSYGCLLYEALTGRVLFYGKDERAVFHKVLTKCGKLPRAVLLQSNLQRWCVQDKCFVDTDWRQLCEGY